MWWSVTPYLLSNVDNLLLLFVSVHKYLPACWGPCSLDLKQELAALKHGLGLLLLLWVSLRYARPV